MAAEEFLSEFDSNMEKIKNDKDSGDIDDYAIMTHAMKSNARYMGFEDLGEISLQHELAGKEKNMDFINSNYDALVVEANRVNEVLKKYMES